MRLLMVRHPLIAPATRTAAEGEDERLYSDDLSGIPGGPFEEPPFPLPMEDRLVPNEVGLFKVSKPLLRWRMRPAARESPVLIGRGVAVGLWRSTRADEGSARSSAAEARASFRFLGPLHPRLVHTRQPGTVGQPLERSTRLLPLQAVR